MENMAVKLFQVAWLAPALLLAGSGAAPSSQDNLVDGKPLAGWLQELRSADAARRDRAVQILARAGKPALPALKEALQSPDLLLRRGAVQALGAMDAPAAEEAIA